MAIQFCAIREKSTNKVLCDTYNEGYHYSEYTHQDAYISRGFLPLEKCFGEKDLRDDEGTIMLFESIEKAELYLLKNYSYKDRNLFEVLSFAALDAVVEAYLLGKTE